MNDRPALVFRLALRCVPPDWRASVLEDLRGEAGQGRLAQWWCACQTLGVAVALHWTFTRTAIMSDIRYAIRSMLHARWFTVGAILTFALGIGVNIAVFSAVDRMLFRQLPYPHPGELVMLRDCPPPTGDCAGSFPGPVAYEAQGRLHTLTDLAVVGWGSPYRTTSDPNDDRFLQLVSASPNVLQVLEVTPILGRLPTATELARRQHLAWLSYDTWRTRFGGVRDIVGRPVYQGKETATIIGVLPRGFIPPSGAILAEWSGLVIDYDGWSMPAPTGRIEIPFARLRSGLTPAAAQTELDGLVRSRGEALVKAAQFQAHVRVDPLQVGIFAQSRRYLQLVAAAVVMVWLVACANLASLFLARGRARERQAAVCVALGASRGRLMATALVESGLTCAAGALLALGALALASHALTVVLPPILNANTAGLTETRIVGFALLVTIAGALLTGLLPSWQLARVDVLRALQQSSTTGRHTRVRGGRGLLAVEAAFGCVLVLGAGLAVRSLYKLMHDDIGMVPTGLYVVRAGVASEVHADPAARLALYQQKIDIARQMPGVIAAGGADVMPTTNMAPMAPFDKSTRRGARYQITRGYFEAMGTSVIGGHTFTAEELESHAPVAIMSRSGARLVWPDRPPAEVVGRVWQPAGETPRQVVGVVEDLKTYYGDDHTLPAAVYLPIGAEQSRFLAFAVRMAPGRTLDAALLRTRLQAQLGQTTLRLTDVPKAMDPYVRDPRFRAVLFTTLALVGLLLSAVGLYAVASYEVAQRRYEMGVRLALGADPSAIARLVIRDACMPVCVGGAGGLMLAYWATPLAAQFLYKVDGRGFATYAMVLVVLIGTAAVAAWFPARDAARTDPAVVLKAN